MSIRSVSCALFACAAMFASSLLTGCTDETVVCSGILEHGKCVAKCKESRDCQANQRCVATGDRPDGVCYAECLSNAQCAVGEECVTTSDASLSVCVGRAAPGVPGDACSTNDDCDGPHAIECVAGACQSVGGIGAPCTSVADCAQNVDLVCASGACLVDKGGECQVGQCAAGACSDGRCAPPCSRVSDCAEGTDCKPLEGRRACVASPNYGAGRYLDKCPNGKTDCDQVNGFFCTSGDLVGSADAYCTVANGCQVDDDCPSAFVCKSTVPRGGSATVTTVLWGEPYEHECVHRDFCDKCETNFDCSYMAGGLCVPDKDGEKYCSTACDPKVRSCFYGASCVEVTPGDFACRPDAGVCHSKATPTTCDPCRDDADCGYHGICLSGSVQGAIGKPGVDWCSTPCLGPDANGKAICPPALNGTETLCLDDQDYFLGPVAYDDTLYDQCYSNLSFDNTETYAPKPPPRDVCGNGIHETGEDCDDGNVTAKDGCSATCTIEPACDFTLAADNADGTPSLTGSDGTAHPSVPTSCRSFRVHGSTDKAGQVHTVAFGVPESQSALVSVYAGGIGLCTADMQLELREGTIDLTVPCTGLSETIIDEADEALCPNGNFLACGSCTQGGLCGSCDDDSGVGDCPRHLVSTSTVVAGENEQGQEQDIPIKFASSLKTARIYAHDAKATVTSWDLVVERQAFSNVFGSAANSPLLTCW